MQIIRVDGNSIYMPKKTVQLVTISVIHFSPWIPYAAGCLISYCNKIPQIANTVEFLEPIFEYKPIEEYDSILLGVDILGITCYVWNQVYNDRLAKRFKELNPTATVIYGGPNIPEVQSLAADFLNARPWVDTLFIGPGEENFSQWLLGKSTEGTVTRDSFNVSNMRAYQIRDNDMPTPYSDGIFDNIFKNAKHVKTPFETNRGCPYSCAFCDWGGQSRSKLSVFEIDKVKAQLDYIYQHRNITELELLDANFGVLRRDVEIIEYMIELQKKNDNVIKLGYAGLAKNGSKDLPRILDLMASSMDLSQRNQKLSFQTHTKQVLSNIDRDNIDNSKLLNILESCKADGVVTTSELIMALPGETADTWLDTISTNHNLGIDYIRTYILNYVPNTTMYTEKYREKFKIKSKKIRFPYKFNGLTYKKFHENGNVIINDFTDYEEYELMIETESWNLEEIVKMFDYTWWYHNMWNAGALRPVAGSIKEEITEFFLNLDNMPFVKSLVKKNREIVRKLFNDEPVTRINDLETYLYYSKCMRTDEVFQIWNNRKLFAKEMSQIYGESAMNFCINEYMDEFTMKLYGTDAIILKNKDSFLLRQIL